MFSLILRILLLFFCFFSASCKKRSNGANASLESQDVKMELVKEALPFNRLPVEQLKRDAEEMKAKGWKVPDRIVSIQEKDGRQFGLRLMTASDLEAYVEETDIKVDYHPLSDPRTMRFESAIRSIYEIDPEMDPDIKRDWTPAAKMNSPDEVVESTFATVLAENGMGHAAMMLRDDKSGKLCHIDSPRKMSGCTFEKNSHFFRIDVDDSVKAEVLRLLQLLSKDEESFQYDLFLYSDVNVSGISPLRRAFEKSKDGKKLKLSDQYCSELPLSLYSLATGKIAWETGFNLIDFATSIYAYKDTPAFEYYAKQEVVQKSLVAFIQGSSSVPDSVRPYITSAVKQAVGTGAVGASVRGVLKNFYPSLVLPKHFMQAALDPSSLKGLRVYYIGSIERPEQVKDKEYYSSILSQGSRQVFVKYYNYVKSMWSSAK